MEYEVKLGDNVNAFRRMYKILFPSQLCIKRLDKLAYTCMVEVLILYILKKDVFLKFLCTLLCRALFYHGL